MAGIVKIGQTMTMVLAIKDEENKFDMLVRNCFAHDGKRGPIELVDKSGCITRPKLMSRFTKIKNFGSSATVLSYAHFQAFKFPDSMEVHFQCTIQICRHQCPEQCAAGPQAIGGAGGSNSGAAGEAYSESTISGTMSLNGGQSGSMLAPGHADSVHLRKYGLPALSRERRSATESGGDHERRARHHHHINARRWLNGSHYQQHNNSGAQAGNALGEANQLMRPLSQAVGVNRIIQVVSTGDLAFAVQRQAQDQTLGELPLGDSAEGPQASQLTRAELGAASQICMSSYNFVLALVMLALILLCSSMLAVSLYMRQRSLLASSGANKLNKLAAPAQAGGRTSSSTLNKLFQPQDCHSPSQSGQHVPSKQQQQGLFAHHNQQFYAGQ